jgi:hypothetical protein
MSVSHQQFVFLLLLSIPRTHYHYPRTQSIKWLDKLTFRKIEKINQEAGDDGEKMFLIVDLPNFQRPIVFHQKVVLSFIHCVRVSVTLCV